MPLNPASASNANISAIDSGELSAFIGDGSDDAVGDPVDRIDGAAGFLFLNGLIQVGTDGNDVLPGGPGINIMLGRGGDDIYHVDNPGDRVLEGANGGNDIVYSSIDYTIPGNVESVVLTGAGVKAIGNNLDNALIGNSGNNVLDGRGGNDFMRGGAGNDLYFVDSAGDVVVENATEGNDIVYAAVDYTLSADVDSLVLVEGSAATGAAGNDLDNALIGNSNANALDGRGGDDYMVGRAGNDIYFVDSVGDAVVENPGEGNDIVVASFDYTLGANVESVVLLEGAGNIDAAGNNDVNALIGNSGNNALDGKGGDDYMVGGAGNDIYFVDSAGDTVVENPNEGNDIVYASIDYTLGANLESLVLIEGAGNINGSGNGAGNALIGNSGNNILDGKGGDDVMMGGGGDDTFRIADSAFASIDGGAGLDRITLTAPGQVFDLTANASKIANVEIISLAASAGAILNLTNTDIPQVNASGNYLYIVGGSDDEVQLGGAWSPVSTIHTNPAVAPGVTFVQYHDAATNAELYISDTIAFTVAFDPDNPPTVFLDGAPDGIDLPDGQGHLAAYTTGDAAGVAISGADASIDDPDPLDIPPTVSAHLVQLTAALTDAHSGALEFLNLTAAGQTIAANNGIAAAGLNSAALTLNGSASDAVYQDLLREIRYVNTDQSAALDTADRHVSVNAFDGIEHSITAIAAISLTNGGDPGSFGHEFLLV